MQPLTGSTDVCPSQGRAGTVYSAGLRRCLIIFAPQTLVLDRRTQPCKAPSPLLISWRSKNFTSGAKVSFTLNVVPSQALDACKPLAWLETPDGRTHPEGHGAWHTPQAWPNTGEDNAPHCPGLGFKTSTRIRCHSRSMLRHSLVSHAAAWKELG